MCLPIGFVAPRSADQACRGPVGVILFNHSDVDFEIKMGDRIAQLILVKMRIWIALLEVQEVLDLQASRPPTS